MARNEGLRESTMTCRHKKYGQAQNKYGWSLPNIWFPQTNFVYSKIDVKKWSLLWKHKHKKCGQAQNKYGWSLPSQIYEFHTAAESTSSKTGKKVSSLPYLLPKVFI